MNKIKCLSLALAVLAIAVSTRGAGKSEEDQIRSLDKAWVQAVQSKDAAKSASFYAEDGSAFPFNAPIAEGKAKVQEMWAGLMAKPGFGLTFAPTKIVVSSAKDMAYDIGTFELKLNDASGSAMTIVGKYVVVWAKQPNGDWKVKADIFNTDK